MTQTFEEICNIIVSKSTDSAKTVKKYHDKFLAEYKERGFPETKAKEFAEMRLKTFYKKQLSSPDTEKIEGVTISCSPKFDMIKKRRGETQEYINQHGLENAVTNGWVNSDGKFLYQRPEFMKGKIMPEHEWQRTITIIGGIEGKDEFSIFRMDLKDENSNADVPTFVPVSFPAIFGKAKEDGSQPIYAPKNIEFSIIEGRKDMDMVEFVGHNRSLLKDHLVTLDELKEWGIAHSDFNDFVIVVANCVRINLTDDSINSNVINIDDVSLALDPDEIETITVWIDKEIPIDFPEQTMELVIVGRCSLNDKDEASINATGLWCHPAFRIDDLPIKEITQENDAAPQEKILPKPESEQQGLNRWG